MPGVRRGAFTSVGWQVTLCDPIWQVTSRSSEMGFPWRAISAFTFTFTHLVVVVVLVVVGATVSKKDPRLHRFKSDWDEIWQDYSSSKYASIDRVGFSIWRDNFKMAAMTSFHGEKCCRLASKHEAYVDLCSSTRQFLIYSTFMLVV